MLDWLKRLFRTETPQYPASHELAMQRVLLTVKGFHETPDIDDETLVAQLCDADIPKVDAELLVLFVPMAFSFAILRRMGVTSFPNTYLVSNRHDKPVEMPIAREHYFSTALQVAFSTTEHGYNDTVTREGFEAIVSRSAEMNAANKLLDKGGDLAGSTVGPTFIMSVTAEEIADSRANL